MAYNQSSGSRDFGDLKYEKDTDTQIDWDDDSITFKTNDVARVVINNSRISGSGDATFVGNTVIGGTLSVSGAVTFGDTSVFNTGITISKDLDAEFIALKLINESDAADTTGAVSIEFDLEDSSGTEVDAGKIKVKKEQGYTSDPPTQDSSMVFATSLNGTVTDYMTLDSQGTLTLEGEIIGKNNATFGETGESDYFTVKSTGNALMFRVDGANDMVGIGQNPTHTLSVAGDISGSGVLKNVGTAKFGASVFVTGSVTAGNSFIIGNASMNETDLEKLDGITDGTAVANKAVVLDGSKNIATLGTVGCGAITSTGTSTFNNISGSGTATFVGNTVIGGTLSVTGNVGFGTASPSALLDADGDAIFNNSGDDNDFPRRVSRQPTYALRGCRKQ